MATVPGSTGRASLDGVAPGERDPYIDFLRAFSLLVVIVWHWVFTILVWREDGPHATNPIGFFDGLFLATWLFQVMPLFFFVGGFAHQQAWASARAGGMRIWTFVGHRARALVVPALALIVVWAGLGIAVTAVFDIEWMGRAVLLVLSPLWFLAVYLLLIVALPLTLWLHQRFGVLVLVWAVGLAALVDVVRFRNDWPAAGWLNMLFVWGFCHQLGYFYRPLVTAGRRVAWALLWGGLFTLLALVYTGLYPGSMVGVPGDRFSNMAPPTVPLLGLVLFQAGLALLLRPAVLHRLRTRARWSSANEWLNRFALPLYLFHSTGMALARWGWHLARGGQERRQPDLVWWLTRPLAFTGALVVTLPVIVLFGRRWAKRPRQEPGQDPPDDAPRRSRSASPAASAGDSQTSTGSRPSLADST